jgi:hypothetical protein
MSILAGFESKFWSVTGTAAGFVVPPHHPSLISIKIIPE